MLEMLVAAKHVFFRNFNTNLFIIIINDIKN